MQLNRFTYQQKKIEGRPMECLEVLLKWVPCMHLFFMICCYCYTVHNHKSFFNLYFPLHFHRQCGVKDPSWSEIKHFVCFLDTQLRSCENSEFCNEDNVGDVMSGLKTFAVKFMVRMSKVRTSFIIKWSFSFYVVDVYILIHSFTSFRILLHLHWKVKLLLRMRKKLNKWKICKNIRLIKENNGNKSKY